MTLYLLLLQELKKTAQLKLNQNIRIVYKYTITELKLFEDRTSFGSLQVACHLEMFYYFF